MKNDNIFLKIQRFGAGLLVYQMLNRIFDLLIAPLTTYYFEFWVAFTVLYVLNLIKTWLLIHTYDRAKTDWFQMESFKEKELGIKDKTFLKFSISSPLIFFPIFLISPVFAILYKRAGIHQYNGIPKQVWWIYFVSNLTSTALLILAILGIFSVGEWLWQIITHAFM